MNDLFGFGFVAAVFLWIGHSRVRSFRARRQLEQAAYSVSWTDLTDGSVTAAHQGRVVTFWARGRVSLERRRANDRSIFVCIDEVAMTATLLRPWPRHPITAIYRRADAPVLRAEPSWLGPTLTEDSGGLFVTWNRMKSPAEFASVLASLGWPVAVG